MFHLNCLGENCLNIGDLLHEMLHTVGFFHEHQRPDRDNFVKVDLQNIPPGKDFRFQFEIFKIQHLILALFVLSKSIVP